MLIQKIVFNFAAHIARRGPIWARGWVCRHNRKRLLNALSWLWKSDSFIILVKNAAASRWLVDMYLICAGAYLREEIFDPELLLHICVRPSAVARSTKMGNVRASKAERVTSTDSHAFFFYKPIATDGESKGTRKHMARTKAQILSLDNPSIKIWMIDYLSFYSKISSITTDKSLNNHFPSVKPRLLSLFNSGSLIIKTNAELVSYDFNSINKEMLVFSKKSTKTLCLLRHIRNAIAHCYIKQNKNGEIIICDYKDNSKTIITCYGIVSIDTFIQILKIAK